MTSRRERKKKQTRDAILDAAATLFADRGIFGTRVEDITERVDLGKGAFYNYFPSKDALIAELVSQGLGVLEGEYLNQLNGTSALRSRVEELTRLHNTFFEEHPRYMVLFHQARGLMQVKTKGVGCLREVFGSYLLSIGKALPPSSEQDQWAEEDLLDFAAVIAGGIAGYRSYRAAIGDSPNNGTAADALSRGVPKLMEERRVDCAHRHSTK